MAALAHREPLRAVKASQAVSQPWTKASLLLICAPICYLRAKWHSHPLRAPAELLRRATGGLLRLGTSATGKFRSIRSKAHS